MFEDYDPDHFYDIFGCETAMVLPLFFEHKIANAHGSYRFYDKIISKPIDRSCIDNINQNDINSFIKELQNK